MTDSPAPNNDSRFLQTVDKLTRHASEDLVRTLDRRTFLKRAGTGAFFFMAALATGQAVFNPRRAAAAQPGPTPKTPAINCSPPGPYCNNGGGTLSGCHGAHCFDHLYNGQLYACHVYYQYYPGGCWTSGSGSTAWTCCDCSCGTPQVTTCGCAQQTGAPSPVPMHGN